MIKFKEDDCSCDNQIKASDMISGRAYRGYSSGDTYLCVHEHILNLRCNETMCKKSLNWKVYEVEVEVRLIK